METKYFVKQGFVQKAKGKILGGFDLNRFVKWFLGKINVPYADPCCLEDQERFPVAYNEEDSTFERFDSETLAWVAVDTTPTSFTTDTITESTANAGVTVEGVKAENGGLSNSGETMFVPFIPTAAQNNITAGTGGAISVANYYTTINTDAGGDNFTLANGTQIGQLKKIFLVADGGGDGVVTPATAFAGGATTATFNDANDALTIMWNGAAWAVIENVGVTVA
jgi:hypothetical protein